ncbi:putative GTPase activating protein for Arf [Aspergillus fischeri NRRL 181]|uniref:GTPase activating protein for Arf, putative n=1 Tax=Neosartorya fischeri (strain ATCC 1020 / DSM 3700 / CBS 544.65 / FGSC A1164 / JCM 1740 / NRRL 181 / WB 181) TaxID=331117 RepID=A1CX62_NEOFI|nr:GTPase activating protein for Arf, putative [Aspergillus fischeri NRRL 181]EAW25214.1 GTPase activating protein for Arf, putative [Aspergillus fischeri NRRL 181]
MPSIVSKRQQQRNEKALQDLIRSVPGNDRCADCGAFNPALHRKLGTHISKVKSLTMDTWTAEQVDVSDRFNNVRRRELIVYGAQNMKSHGNTLMNKIFNPKNVKPPVPKDIDEADSSMERYIRQKYQYRSLEDGKPKPPSRHDSSYDISPEGSPPPLPPKSGRFPGPGLRSASSTSNLQRSSNRPFATSPRSERPDSPPPRSVSTSGSQGFGLSVRDTSDASFESKLAQLRDLGFTNERRNAAALKGLDGNLKMTIETLQRLGEGPASLGRPSAAGNPTNNSTRGDSSANPFDLLDSKPSPQTSSAYNPFDMPTSQAQQQLAPAPAPVQSLEGSFQHLQVSQPLFPHQTGGYPGRQASLPQPLYQHPLTPPITSTQSQGTYISSPQAFDGSQNPFFQSSTQPQAPFTSTPLTESPGVAQTNPFFSQFGAAANSMQSQPQSVSGGALPNPPQHANTMPALSSTSPFSQGSYQQQQQPQQQQFLQNQPHLQGQGFASQNPFQSMAAPNTPQNAVYQHQYQPQLQAGMQQPTQYMAPQPTGRVDKGSILSLYNTSSAQASGMQQPSQMQAPTGMSLNQAPPNQPMPSISEHQNNGPQASAAPQLAGSRNPFMGGQGGPGAGMDLTPKASQLNGNFPRTHMSQQSVDINGFQSGRHSPDAFANLSARYR